MNMLVMSLFQPRLSSITKFSPGWLDNQDKNNKQSQNLANNNVQKDVSLNILQGRHGQISFKKQIGHGNNSQGVFSQ